MSQEEFKEKLFNTLTMDELQNLNTEIYFNPDHVEYYTKYHQGAYSWCWDYLMEHRNLLNTKEV